MVPLVLRKGVVGNYPLLRVQALVSSESADAYRSYEEYLINTIEVGEESLHNPIYFQPLHFPAYPPRSMNLLIGHLASKSYIGKKLYGDIMNSSYQEKYNQLKNQLYRIFLEKCIFYDAK